MTIDQDRGAYAPHMDAPLAFDARRPSDRRPLPMTLIASAGVLVLIVGALAMAYRGGVRGTDQPRLVGEPVGAIKTAAAPEAASDAGSADSKLDVYAAQNVPTRAAAAAPAFAPPPEQPAARAAPAPATAPTGLQVRTVEPVKVRIGEPEATPSPALTVAERQGAATSRTAVVPGAADRAAPSTKPAVPAEAASPKTAATNATKRDIQAATTVPKRDKAETTAAAAPARGVADAPSETAPAAKPVKLARADADAAPATKPGKAVKAAAKPALAGETAAAPATSSAKAGAAAVQVGAFSSAALAQQGFADAGKLSPLGGHAKSVEKVSRDGKTFYRATLGGFADKAAAKAFCAKLTAAGGRCLVKG